MRGKVKMNIGYTEAVQLALAGEEQGFGYLYENTYKTKYYLALQYMKNQEAAEDVLQDAYIRAFSKLDTLQDPENFSAWLGQIVANTAKNATNKETVREKVEPAVLDSYGTDGNIDATLLNNKLKERGIYAKITSFPATIEVDGYNITIQEDGTVTIEE